MSSERKDPQASFLPQRPGAGRATEVSGVGRETCSASCYSRHLKRMSDGFVNSFHAKLVYRETSGIFPRAVHTELS